MPIKKLTMVVADGSNHQYDDQETVRPIQFSKHDFQVAVAYYVTGQRHEFQS